LTAVAFLPLLGAACALPLPRDAAFHPVGDADGGTAPGR
jgi:hypothetical protein